MPHIYLLFDFAKDEEKAQQARHKLEVWKQAFRLDKKLLYKLDRIAAAPTPEAAKPAKAEKTKGKGKAEAEPAAPASNETVRLIVRLGFSGHEKLTEQRWMQRIPAEELFQAAAPKIVKPDDALFEETEREFEELS